jgi:DNA-binding transcriptional ArsR family regulator
MRRDMDVVRQLLLHIESDDVFDGSSTGVVTAAELDLPIQVVTYHMKLLVDAGLVDRADWLASGDPIIRGLTWQGHEFIDAVRDPEIWRKTKASGKEAGGWTLGLLKDVATALVKDTIKKHIGFDF